MRPIDADALHAKIYEDSERNYGASANIAQVLLRIETAPTLDVDPVVHANLNFDGEGKTILDKTEKFAPQMRDEIRDMGKDSICAQVFAEICYILHNDFGFGENRLRKLHKSVNALNAFMQTGFAGKSCDTMNCVEWLKKYAGIDVMEESK